MCLAGKSCKYQHFLAANTNTPVPDVRLHTLSSYHVAPVNPNLDQETSGFAESPIKLDHLEHHLQVAKYPH